MSIIGSCNLIALGLRGQVPAAPQMEDHPQGRSLRGPALMRVKPVPRSPSNNTNSAICSPKLYLHLAFFGVLCFESIFSFVLAFMQESVRLQRSASLTGSLLPQ